MRSLACATLFLSASCTPMVMNPTISGVPVNETQIQDVYDAINTQAPIAFHRDAAAPLEYLQGIDFVSGLIPCGSANECLGVTYSAPWGPNVKVAMLLDTYGATPTDDVRCTALAHELGHVTSGSMTGNYDPNHTNDAVWGPEGMVQMVLDQLCPGMEHRSQNMIAEEHHDDVAQ